MALTPALIIAASKLTSNIGLEPSSALTTVIDTVNSNSLVSGYANLQPGTTNGNVLAGRSFSVVSLALPDFIANANTVIASVQTRNDKILPSLGGGMYNVPKFASLLSTASSFASTSLAIGKTLSSLSGKEFEDFGIDVTDHSSTITNGLSNVFGSQSNLTLVANAVANLGTAFDATQLSRLHKPSVFIANLQRQGFLPSFSVAATDEELIRDLTSVQGAELARIITQTKIQLPRPVTDLSQLLDLTQIFSSAAVAATPGQTLAGLSNVFLNLGGRFITFSAVANMLNSIEIPSIPYLDAYTELVPTADYNALAAKLGVGNSATGTPLVTDMLGSIAGVVHTDSLTAISSALTTVMTYPTAITLSTQLSNLATLCAGGNVTLIDAGIVQLQSAAGAFNSAVNSDSVIASGNSNIAEMRTQLQTELTNLTLAGIDLDGDAPIGVAEVLSLVTSLHNYGVDAQALDYNTLFTNCAQGNAGGDAIRAALAEGRNISHQSKGSIREAQRYEF